MRELPEILAAFAFFGLLFVCPLVFMLLRHQRTMAEFIHRSAGNEALHRIEMLEQQLRELRAAHHELVVRQDTQIELSQRVSE
jgi:hypothetical protein